LWKSPRRMGGAMEREEDELSCSGMEEMPVGGVEV
jgi:hypothetical protein